MTKCIDNAMVALLEQFKAYHYSFMCIFLALFLSLPLSKYKNIFVYVYMHGGDDIEHYNITQHPQRICGGQRSSPFFERYITGVMFENVSELCERWVGSVVLSL